MLTRYPGEDARPLRVAVLCSHRAPGLLDLLRDARRGDLFEIVACVSSEHDFQDREAIALAGVPTFVHDIGDFYRSWNARRGDLELRKHYDAMIVQRLAIYDPDLIILCSYLYLVTRPLLEAYPQRVVNIHHSDLPQYPGLHAVRDAILAGAHETRATVHMVTRDLDAGPAMVRSWAFPVHPMVDDLRSWNATQTLKAYVFAHQEWMIESAWAPLMTAAIELFARGEVQTWGDELLISGSTRALELEPAGRSLHSLRPLRSMR
ncbi:MAG TPA: formyltransferase family protein [Longimicrobiales bacterium]